MASCNEAILAGTAGPECAAAARDALARATQAQEAALARQAAADANKERTAAAVTEAHRGVTKAWTDPTVPEAETAEARIEELMLARYKLHHRATHAPGDLSLKKEAGESWTRVLVAQRALQGAKDAEREANPRAAKEQE